MPNYLLFVGSDIATHLLLNELAPAILKRGVTPVIIQVKEPVTRLPRQLESLKFYERHLPGHSIYPFLETRSGPLRSGPLKGPAIKRPDLTGPAQLARALGFPYHRVDTVNSDSFYREIVAQADVIGGTSLRCHQKFGRRIIEHFKATGFLWNLHPGDLPGYRGLLPLFRTLQNGETHNILSLHEIACDYDTGACISKAAQVVDPAKSVFEHFLMLRPVMLGMVTSALDDYLANGSVQTTEQTGESRYYSWPTQAELEAAEARGIHLAPPPADLIDFYVSVFGHGYSRELRQHLIKASAAFEDSHQILDHQAR